jgi:TatD DNase family protein
MFIDTHAHVNFSAFKKDEKEVILRSLEEETWMILVGSDYKTSKRALELSNKYEKGVYAAVGLHPIHTHETKAEGDDYSLLTKAEEFNYDNYEKLAKFEKVVAIGEIGLDYYHIDYNGNVAEIKKEQKDIFLRQLELARNLDLPVIIHCRQAHDDMAVLLKNFKKENKELFKKDRPWGVMHCFSGDENLAWQYFSMGLLISFTGLVTFSKQWDDLIRKLPSDKFLIETDCPFMTPEPFRGKRNEPVLVKYVAKRIAEIKNLTVERVGEITTVNAKELFNI